MSNTRKMKIEISVGYECDESVMEDIQSGLINRIEGMLQLGDFDFVDEEGNVKYTPRGWDVDVEWGEIQTPPAKDISTDDRLEPDTFRHQRVHSPVGQELAMNFSWTSDKERDKENAMREETHGQERAKGTGEET